MADQTTDEYFVDMVSNVSHANGVFRITFAQQETEESISPKVKLLIPVNQLSRMVKGISDAANEIGRRVREKAEEDSGEEPVEEAADTKSGGRNKKK